MPLQILNDDNSLCHVNCAGKRELDVSNLLADLLIVMIFRAYVRMCAIVCMRCPIAIVIEFNWSC